MKIWDVLFCTVYLYLTGIYDLSLQWLLVLQVSHKGVTKPDQRSNKDKLTACESEQVQTRANGHKLRAHKVKQA